MLGSMGKCALIGLSCVDLSQGSSVFQRLSGWSIFTSSEIQRVCVERLLGVILSAELGAVREELHEG